jgi:uroporphyrinogen-III synthase
MTVLVIRPEEQGQELCQQLENVGIRATLLPLIDMKPVAFLEPLFSPSQIKGKIDIIIAVSQHAVRFSDQLLRQKKQSWPSNVRYLAIGQKTAQLLSKLTQQTVDYPEISDSEHLLEAPLLTSVSGLNIIILRGHGGRELIAKQLITRGANVVYREVYRREPRLFDAKSSMAYWQKNQIDSLIVTSYEQLKLFVDQLPSHYHQWLFTLSIYVPSERVARLALSIGFKNTITVGSASNSDLVAALFSQRMTGIPNDQ